MCEVAEDGFLRARFSYSLPESMCFPALTGPTFCDSPAAGSPWDLNSPGTVGSGQLCPQNVLDVSRLGMGGHTELPFGDENSWPRA